MSRPGAQPAAPGAAAWTRRGRVLVIGYLGIDHVVHLSRPLGPGQTSLVTDRLTSEEGRLGGCAAHVGVGLAEAGGEVDVAGWVGPDHAGARLRRELEVAGVGVGGIESTLARTPQTWLGYTPGGPGYCVYDPGGAPAQGLSPVQRGLASRAVCCIVTVGPPGASWEALAALPPDAALVWAVKADPASFPELLMERLVARADAVLFSQEETPFLARRLGPDWRRRARADALLVETLGAAGLRYSQSGGGGRLDGGPSLAVDDPTGAGDRLVAGTVAGLRRGRPVEASLRQGMEAARALLRERAEDG